MRLTSDRTANRIRSNSNSYTAGFVLKMDGCTQPWDTRKNRAAAQHATRESSSFARTPSWYLSLMRELPARKFTTQNRKADELPIGRCLLTVRDSTEKRESEN